MFKGFGGLVTAGTGGWGVVAPGGVCAEVALAGSQLVKAARGKPIEAHERVGLDRGAVGVSGRVWRGLFPFYTGAYAGDRSDPGGGLDSVRIEGAGRLPGGFRTRQVLG